MSKIIVDTIESTGTTVTVNDALTTGTNAITAGSVTGLTATSITSGTLAAARLPSMNITASTGDVTITGALPSTITFAGAGVAAKVYQKDQSTSTYSIANSTFHTTGMGFYHAFSSTKTYVVHAVIDQIYCDVNAHEWTSVSYVTIKRDTTSTTIPSSGSTTLPGTAMYDLTFGQSGPNTSTLNHDSWSGGLDLRIGPFTGTGTTDMFYAGLRTYNTNVNTALEGIRWVVEEYDVAPATMS